MDSGVAESTAMVLASARPMRQFMVNAAFRDAQEARLGIWSGTVRNVAIAAFAAAGLMLAGVPDAFADNRAPKRQSINNYSVAVAQSKAESGRMERKCMILPCGTPWCYSVRR